MNNWKGLAWLSWALMSCGFFALIGFAVYWTNSAWPLWALLLYPGGLRTQTTAETPSTPTKTHPHPSAE
jgi:hypothetical protein